MRTTRTSVTAGLFLVLALAVGCSDDGTAEVSGEVTVDGNPVDGSIGFTPSDGKGATSGGDIKGGKYSFRAPVGPVKVAIRVPRSTGKVKKLYNTPDSPTRDIMEESLPAKYNEKTELTFEVKSGRNQKNWELKSK